MRKTILFLFLVLTVFAASAAMADTDGDYTFMVSGNSATVTGYSGSAAETYAQTKKIPYINE